MGVNRFQSQDAADRTAADRRNFGASTRSRKLTALKQRRGRDAVQKALDALRRAAEGTENTMPYILDAVRAYATLGEICDSLRERVRHLSGDGAP